MTTMADMFREKKKKNYENPQEFFDLVLGVDPKAYSQLHTKVVIHFRDGSTYEMEGLMPHPKTEKIAIVRK